PRILPQEPEFYFQRALETDPSDKRPYQSLALSEMHRGRLDEAIKWLKTGLKKVQDTDGKRDLRWSLALAHLEKGDLSEAAKDIKDLRARSLATSQLRFLEGYLA